MEHIESAIKVFFTKDYSRFRMINGNRQLNEQKIKRIINDMENGIDVLRYCPVLVKENGQRLDIIDGQHRFYVSRKRKTNVWYILVEEMTLHSIAKINSNTEKWKTKDFINCYVQIGNENYVKLRELIEKYPISITDALCMLQEGTVIGGGNHKKDDFEQGHFKVQHATFTHNLLSIVSLFQFPNKYSRGFLIAIQKVIDGEKVNIEEFISKINANKFDLIKQSTYKEYLLNLESVYNKGKQNRIIIY